MDSNRGDGRALVCGTPCPGHGNARHGVDHGGLHLGLALVRFGPEVLSSSSMGRRFSCSSKNKSRRVSWAVTGRFICSITSTVVTPGNAGDANVAADLIEDLLGDGDETEDDDGAKPKVYGDNAYGTGEFQSKLEGAGIASGCKAQSPSAAGGLFTKDRFNIDLGARTITCPICDGPGPLRPRRERHCLVRPFVHELPVASLSPPPPVGAPSGSAPTQNRQPAPGTVKKALNGLRTIAPPAPRSNASSGTSCAAVMAGASPCTSPDESSR